MGRSDQENQSQLIAAGGLACWYAVLSATFEDVHAAYAVCQIYQATLIDGHIVALNAVRAFRQRRQVVSDFARRVRIGEVHYAQSLSKPSDGNLSSANFLAELVASGMGQRLVDAHQVLELESCNRNRPRFIADFDDPHE